MDDQGQATELVLDSLVASRFGGPLGLDRKRGKVFGNSVGPRKVLVHSIELTSAAGAEASTQIGSRPYITIGCKFPDVPGEPRTIATYRDWTAGTSYPGLTHYWREQSYNKMDVAGSTVVGWYTLPFPRADYVPAAGADLWALVTDCTSAADPDVNFPSYYGINLQFNGWLDCCSWGGGATLTLDGQTKSYGTTWMASWADLAVYAHEEGHSLGLPHSSGPYGQTYDSRWDVMSQRCTFFDDAQSTCIPQHTIAYHKGLLGWIASARSFTVQPNSSQTITLERLAQPNSGNYLVAHVPLTASVEYTIEARRLVGYDGHLPANAVVLHRVEGWAKVVDVDNNGDPNDAGAEWTVGETFTDPSNGIRMTVNAVTASGFQITVSRSVGAWAALAPLPSGRQRPVAAAVGGSLYVIGGLNSSATAQRSVFAYSPSTNSWSTKAQLPAARYGGAATAVNGLIYVAGGLDLAGKPTRTLYVYTPGTNTWATKASVPAASGCGGSAAISGKLYLFTGCTLLSTGQQTAAKLLHRYDPSTNSWTSRTSAPASHFAPVVAADGSKLYVVGGDNTAGVQIGRLDVYDASTNTWVTRAPMGLPRVSAAGAAVGGLIYVVGGRRGDTYLSELATYDPSANWWSTRVSMPTARAGLAASLISKDGRIYAVGGRNSGSILTANERFTP